MTDPLLSVVVIGRNEGQNLARCLDSIADLRSLEGSFEVIYVDSASTDGSPRIASDAGAEVIVLDADRPTAALGRNAGWRRAQAPYILFLDGDTVVDQDFARLACETISKDDAIAAVWGHRREIHPEQSLYNRLLDLDWIYAPGETEFCGGDVLLRRSALEKVSGYDAALIAGEEPELCRRMRACGYRILHLDCPMTGHDLKMTSWKQYWRRATRAGHAYAEVSSRFRSTPDPFWAAESRANLLRGSFWIGSFAAAGVALPFTVLPLVMCSGLLMLMVLRSAWKARWKSPGNAPLLLLYGLHSHSQQIPILVGQLQYYFDKRAGRRRKLIEYKQERST